MRFRALALVLALIVPSERVAHADGPLAPAAAVIPGFVVHGTGHFVAGQPAIGRRLLLIEGIGLAMLAGSLGGLAATGASRYTVVPFAVGAVVGFDLFALSFLADVYGTAAPGGLGTPLRATPRLEAEVGVRFVHDPQFAYGALAFQRLNFRHHRVRLSPSAWQAPSGRAGEVAFLAGYRLVGPTTDPADAHGKDGSALDLEGAAGHRSYQADGFATTTVEARASGRLDLFHLGSTLRGSFTELSLGVALAKHQYAIGASENDTILLTRFALGMYLGPAGELSMHFDHRRDTLAGGMLVPGIGAGYLGFAGASFRTWIGDTFGFAVEGDVGSAWLLGAALRVRQGGRTW